MPLPGKTIFQGNPPSAAHQPDKIEAAKWADYIESLTTAAQYGNTVWFETKSALDSDLDHDAGTPAVVYGDAANNGVYLKSGASGAGSWTRILSFLPGYQFVTATDAGAGTADAIVATALPEVSYTDGAQIITLNIFETNSTDPVTVAFDGNAALDVKTASGSDPGVGALVAGMRVIGVVAGSASEFRLLSDIASAAVQQAAEDARDAAETSENNAASSASEAAGYLKRDVRTKSANFTVATSERADVYLVTAAATASLPAAATVGDGHWFTLIADGAAATIDPDGSEQINGSATLTVSDGTSVDVFCDGTGWRTSLPQGGLRFDTVTDFFASNDTSTAGTYVRTDAEGFAYRAVDTATASTVSNAGGQAFEVLPGADGKYNIMSMGADNTGATDVSALAQKLHDGISDNGFTIVFPAGRYLWTSEFTITKSSVKLEGDLQYSASTGSYIILGANLGADSMIKLDEDENRVGFPTQGCQIHGLSFLGDDRAYDCEAAINIHYSDLTRLSNLRFKKLKGSAIRSKRNVRGICYGVDTQQCGDTGKPTLNIEDGTTADNNLTQGATWTAMAIESNYGIGFYEGVNTQTSNYNDFRFESAEGQPQPHYILKGENGNFANFAQGRQDGATSATGQVQTIGSKFVNLEIAGNVNGQTPMVVTGQCNVFLNIQADGRPGGVDKNRTFLDLGGNNNSVSNVTSKTYGRIVISGQQNNLRGTNFLSSGGTEIRVSGNRNTVDGHASHFNDGTTNDPVIDVTGFENKIVSPYVRVAQSTGSIIKISGELNGLLSPTIISCTSATAVEDAGNINTLDGSGGLIEDAGKHGVFINGGEPLRVCGFTIIGAGLTAGTWNGLHFAATSNVTRGGVVSENYITQGSGALANGIFANDNAGTEYFRRYVVTSNVIRAATTGITFPNTLATSVIASNVTP